MGTSEPHSHSHSLTGRQSEARDQVLEFLMTALPSLRHPWPPIPANKNCPTSCHPEGITYTGSLRDSLLCTQCRLCAMTATAIVLLLPTSKVAFRLTWMFLHLVSDIQCVCVRPWTGNIFTAIRLRKQNFEGKAEEGKEERKKWTHAMTNFASFVAFDSGSTFCGRYELRGRTNNEPLSGMLHAQLSLMLPKGFIGAFNE